jgi:glycerol kinase
VCEALALGALPLRVDGGLARSQTLLQAIADFGGREVQRAAETETTALGAAYLAGLATDVFEESAACRAAIPPPACFEPGLDADLRRECRGRWARTLERARDGQIR